MTDELKYIGQLRRTIDRMSRYFGHRVMEINGVTSLETWKPPTIPEDNQDKYHRINPVRRWRLDLLADYYYDAEGLWWAIAFANDIIDPFMELNDPDEPVFLRIPARRVITANVLR